jgi:hypothetical protein
LVDLTAFCGSRGAERTETDGVGAGVGDGVSFGFERDRGDLGLLTAGAGLGGVWYSDGRDGSGTETSKGLPPRDLTSDE